MGRFEDTVEYNLCIFYKISITYESYIYFVRIPILVLDKTSQYQFLVFSIALSRFKFFMKRFNENFAMNDITMI